MTQPVLRTIKTPRGTEYNVIVETEHYIVCMEPIGCKDTIHEAVLDFEWLLTQGYHYCHHARYIMFEKCK